MECRVGVLNAARMRVGLLVGTAICTTVAAQSDSVRVLAQAEPQVQWESRSRVTGDFDCDGRSDEAYTGRSADRIYVGVVRDGVLTDVLNWRVQDVTCPGPAALSTESLEHYRRDPDAPRERDGF